MNTTFDEHTWINAVTGEIRTNVNRIIDNGQEKIISDAKKRTQFQQQLYDYYGEFFFYRYDTLLDDIDRNTAMAFRYIFLCSVSDKNGCITRTDTTKKCTKESDFINIFNMQKTATYKWVNYLSDTELIYKNFDGYYCVSDKYFAKDLSNDEFRRNSIRTFNKGIQDLYKKVGGTQHSFGGEILKLVPYINIYNNTLCWNISERDPNQIEPLTKRDIKLLFRPDTDQGRKLLEKWERFTMDDELIIAEFSSGEDIHYIVNPRIFYRGNNIQDLKGLMDHFDIATQQTVKKKMKKRTSKGV